MHISKTLSNNNNSSPPEIFLILAGQSNAYGNTDDEPPTRPELYGDIENAYIWDTDNYYTLNFPDNNNGGAFASELSLAYNYTTKVNKPIYIEKTALSNTGIFENESGLDWNVNSEELIVDLRASITRLRDKAYQLGSKNPKFILVWIQGERDARLGYGNEYEDNFNDILAELNAIQQLDYVILNILNSGIINNTQTPYFTKTNIDAVINAQISLANSNPIIENINLNNFNLGILDNLHFDNIGQETVGDELFRMLELKFL